MKSTRRRSLERVMQVAFPELEKVRARQPPAEYRSARRMFGFHKNMHSPGFSFGTNEVARRYLDKLMRETGRKPEKKTEETRLEPLTALKYTERDEYLRLRREILARERVLEKLKAGLLGKSSSKGRYSTEQSPLTATAPALVPFSLNKSDILRSIPALDSPTRVNSNFQRTGLGLAPITRSPGLPKAKLLPYTRRNPKKYEGNPVTGEGFDRNSPRKSATPFGLIARLSDLS